jgi:hypothetical protein
MNEPAEITNDLNAYWMLYSRRKKKNTLILKGGAGSGHHGHLGRAGKRGGSLPSKGGASVAQREPETQSGSSGGRFEPGSTPTKRNDLGQPVEEEQLHALLGKGLPELTHVDLTGFNEQELLEAKWRYSVDGTRKNAARAAAKELAEDSGVSEEVTGDMIYQWAETSNDSDMRSLSIQQAASEEFDVPLSNFQKASLQRVEERLNVNIDSIIMANPAQSRENARSIAISQDERFRSIAPREQERAVLRAMYNNTQARLAAEGYKPNDRVTLYRGFAPKNSSSDDSYSFGEHVNYQGNAIESWTVSRSTANGFGTTVGGITLAMEVPVRNIIGTGRSGFGTLWEGEFVVFGSLEGQVVEVVGN